MGSANESLHHIVMSSLNGWAHTNNDPCLVTNSWIPHNNTFEYNTVLNTVTKAIGALF